MAKKKVTEFKLMCTQVEIKGENKTLIAGGEVKDDKWVDPNDMTLEAVEAVRDFLISQIKGDDKGSGYQWKREDGKYVKLMCTIEDESAEEMSEYEAVTEEAEVHEDEGEIESTIAE